jgi:hypothetical protein
MPPFKLPLDLDHLPKNLRESYSGDHPDRLNFITFLERSSGKHLRTVPKMRDQLLMGSSVFELELIEQQYSKYWFLCLSHERSSMVKLLYQYLEIAETNLLNIDDRLYYLNKLYQFVQKNITDQHLLELSQKGDPCWQNKESLVKKIHAMMKNLIDHNRDQFNQLIYATPDLVETRRAMLALPHLYQAARKKRSAAWQSPEREPMLHLIELIHKSFYYFYPAYESENIPLFRELESKARRGIILAFLLDIDNATTFLNPPGGGWFNNGSELFKKALPILNVKDLDQLTADQKINLLQAGIDHIEKIENDFDYLKLMQEVWQFEKRPDLNTELTKFKEKMYDIKKIEEERKNAPSIKETIVSKAGSFATQSVISYFFRERALEVTAGVAGTVGGPLVGAAVYLSGKLFLTGLAPLIEKQLVTTTTASLYTFALDRIGSTVGAKIAKHVESYSPTKEGLETLIKKMSVDDQKAFKRWVNTLLQLPDDIISENEKQQIRNVLNIAPLEKFKFFGISPFREHLVKAGPTENLVKSLDIRLHS